MKKQKKYINELTAHDALHQSVIGIVLMSILPLLAVMYLSAMIWIQPERMTTSSRVFIAVSTTILAVAGFLILMKFPKNIIKLRQHIADVAAGTLPERISLLNTHSSDDLKFIENGLNMIVREMREQVEQAERQQRVEHELRETIQKQHECIVHAEQHRAMVQSLGAACHHIGQPVTVMEMRLHLMKMVDDVPSEELVQIDECEKAIQQIREILGKLMAVSEFRTEPYIHEGHDDEESEILAI